MKVLASIKRRKRSHSNVARVDPVESCNMGKSLLQGNERMINNVGDVLKMALGNNREENYERNGAS